MTAARPATCAMMAALLPLAACGPISLEAAERQCYERARLAERPRGEVTIGAGSGGHRYGGVSLDISSDYLMGRDPATVYERCVIERTGGQSPTGPYIGGGRR